MNEPSTHTPALRLTLLAERLAICRLAPDAPVPDWSAGWFLSITRTPDELSVVCDEVNVPEAVVAERGWRVLMVAGPLDFELTGVLAALAVPLAQAGVGIFTLSTFDTDYVLVREPDVARALAALEGAGHQLERPPGAVSPGSPP